MKLISFRKIKSGLFDRKNNRILINIWDNEELSFPIIKKEGNRLVETMFVYTKPNSTLDSEDVGLPTALLDVNSSNGSVLKYVLCDADDFEFNKYKPIKHETDLKNREYNIKRLYEIYDKVRLFVFKDRITPQEAIILAEFRVLFYKTVYKIHIPYYEELGKDFFDWMSKELG